MNTAIASPATVACENCSREEVPRRGWFHVLRHWGGVSIRPYSADLDEWPGAHRACGEHCALTLASMLLAIVRQEEPKVQ